MTIYSIFKQNRIFLTGYFLLLSFGLFMMVAFTKVEGHLLLNPFHFKLLDYVFRAATFLGDGIFLLGLALLLFFFRRRYLSLMIIAGYLLSGIPVQIIKSFIEAPRPAIYLKNIDYAYFVEGVTLHNYNSFPSGHTASAFAVAAILAFTFKNKRYSIFFLGIAALVGYSRIYLSQHFMEDVSAGSVIGILSAVTVCLFLEKWFKNITENKAFRKKAFEKI